MTSFQSVATAIAAQVGTGNLTGAATAPIGGGPGAIFWMWMSAFFGMATIYAEATLAQNYKTVQHGEVTGGPVYYIHAAFKGLLARSLVLFSPFFDPGTGIHGQYGTVKLYQHCLQPGIYLTEYLDPAFYSWSFSGCYFPVRIYRRHQPSGCSCGKAGSIYGTCIHCRKSDRYPLQHHPLTFCFCPDPD